MFRRVINIGMIIFLSLLSSCTHLPKDIHPNPAKYGFHRMEFDIKGLDGEIKKEIGIGNFYLLENQDLSGLYFKFYGINKGTLYMVSSSCGINATLPFNGKVIFYLEDLIETPEKCSIRITAETDKIDGKEHNIVETGVIKINVLPESYKAATVEYSRTNSIIFSQHKKYVSIGQGSMQRQEGDLTQEENFVVKTEVDGGGLFRITGCDKVFTEEYMNSSFLVTLKDIYKKDYLKREDTCDFEILVIPHSASSSFMHRFSISIFDKKVHKLENLNWKIKRKKLKVWGRDYIMACDINGSFAKDTKHDAKYKRNKVYWIKGVTTNARKSIFAIKNGNVIWKE